MTRICFVYPNLSSFVKKDLETLKHHYELDPIRPHAFIIPSLDKSPMGIVQLFFKIIKCDLVFCWFADINAFYSVFFGKIFRKKSIVVVGGVDAASFPKYNYGYFSKFSSRIITTLTYKLVDRILPVDDSLKRNIIQYLPFKKEIDKKTFCVPTGYDSKFWKAHRKKEDVVLTVLASIDMNTFFRKGILTFIKAANFFPEYLFIIVGKISKEMQNTSLPSLLKTYNGDLSLPSNVAFTGFVSSQKLLQLYSKSKVYCQFSLSEGLPNSLCEAMLCECVPVGTFVNGIPEAIGNTGFFVKFENVSSAVDGIKKALNNSLNLGVLARKRIITKFPLRKRARELVQMIEETRR